MWAVRKVYYGRWNGEGAQSVWSRGEKSSVTKEKTMRRAVGRIKLAQQIGPNYGGHLLFRAFTFSVRNRSQGCAVLKEGLEKMNSALVDKGGNERKPRPFA